MTIIIDNSDIITVLMNTGVLSIFAVVLYSIWYLSRYYTH